MPTHTSPVAILVTPALLADTLAEAIAAVPAPARAMVLPVGPERLVVVTEDGGEQVEDLDALLAAVRSSHHQQAS